MRRTNPNPGSSKGGRNPRVVHTQRLTDHAGDALTRARYDKPERSIPSNFHDNPVFAFQVYTTVDLGLDEIEASASKRARIGSPTDRTNLFELLSYLNSSLESSQMRTPVFEIYEKPLPDALAMVEHQRREIQHRKSQSQRQDILQIPKLVYSVWDLRRHGFLIAITSDSFKGASRRYSFDPDGPLWVTFDRRLPAASSVELKRRLDCDESHALRADEIIEVYPEKLEIEVRRKQQRPVGVDLGLMYSKSFRILFDEDNDIQGLPLMDIALDEDEVGVKEDQADTAPNIIPGLAAFTIEHRDAHIVIATKGLNGNPTLKYLVYAQYLAISDFALLDSAAKRFTSALTRYLPESTTLELHFYIPQQTTLSSVVQTYQASAAAESNLDVGALTLSTTLSTIALEEQYIEAAHPLPLRVRPISRQPGAIFNDPRTSQSEPHNTFLVVLDKPNFVTEAGVLLLLTDGGKQRNWPTGVPQNAPELDFVETQVWRSAGMKEVADWLAMVFHTWDPPVVDV